MFAIALVLSLLDASIAAHGGRAAIEALDDVDVVYEGRRWMINQSRSVDRLDVEPWRGRTLIDLRNKRLLGESRTTYPVDEVFAYRWILKGDEGLVFDLMKNNRGDEAVALKGRAASSARANFIRNIPALLLLEARDRASSTVADGNRIDVTWPDQSPVTLLIDPKTHLLDGCETKQEDGIEGTVTIVTKFSDYAPIAGVMMPRRRTETFNGVRMRELRYTTKVNTHPADSLFELPAGYKPPSGVPEETALRRLADNVWIDPENGNGMAVVFDDFIVVLEMPVNSATAEATIAKIKAAVPKKPIRYATFTHHHLDHAGGLRAYIAEGATIVTTPGNVRFVQRMGRATIKTFEKKYVFSDSQHSLELYNIGPVSHANELTIGYLPKERILFQADLFFAPQTGPIGPAFPSAKELLKKIEELGLEPQTIIDPDGRVATIDELKASIALMR